MKSDTLFLEGGNLNYSVTIDPIFRTIGSLIRHNLSFGRERFSGESPVCVCEAARVASAELCDWKNAEFVSLLFNWSPKNDSFSF
ncbi:hypothetical protein CEXT_382881 [Caerostris extrusa]|uniref:Uncharacterized protein n=1 Tax=Caerostris extrusa TaxID=172846 RepID=A0AAV4M5P4_CAEEX|nr:hypothetical protein CEXT_382881 [Caerostris extrusa]